MRTRPPKAVIALAAFAFLSSCSQLNDRVIAQASFDLAWSDVAYPDERGCWTTNESLLCPVIVTQEGVLTHRGAEFKGADGKVLQSAWQERGYSVLGVSVHPLADYRTVVQRLAELHEGLLTPKSYIDPKSYIEMPLPRFALVDLEKRYAKVGAERSLAASSEFLDRGAKTKANPYAISVFVGYSRTYEGCVFKLDGLSLSSQELGNQVSNELFKIVLQLGGVAEAYSSPETIEKIVATIQADAGTPWRCVAGATYQIEKSGWPSLRLQVLQD